MSKTSFRPRQVDYTKQMPVYLNDELPDLHEYTTINRSVPQMPSGMEKEEESEHHLQRALSAQQAFGISSTEYAIPTPKVLIDNKKYERIYNFEFIKPKQYIRIQPFLNDYELPDYDCDSDDEEWLKSKANLDDVDVMRFEEIMDRLEKATGFSTNLMTFDEAKFLLKHEDNDVIKCIYDYWREKRIKLKHPLTPTVLTDKSGVQTQPNNPYLVFRRRTEKMQTRKNRKNEEQSYEKMLILKRDLMRAQHLLKLIRKREDFKKELLKLTLEIFEKRYKCNDYDGALIESLKQQHQTSGNTIHSHHQQQQQQQAVPNIQRPLLNPNKNHSIIDKQIANLIHSNELKTLGSPPHSLLKRVSPLDADKKTFLINKLANKTQCTNEHNRQKLEKKRLKKQQLQQQQFKLDQAKKMLNLSANSTTGSSTTTSPLINTTTTPSGMQQHPFGSQTKLKSNKLNRSSHAIISNQSRFNNNSKDFLGEKTNLTMKSQQHGTTTAPSTCSSVSYQSSLVSSTDGPPSQTKTEMADEAAINYEQVIKEALNSLSTNSDNDGYWCFKRKEGCKYLPQNSLNDNVDDWDYDDQTELHAREKYGYMITKNKRHLGLLRRRVGRGGRIVLDRYDNKLLHMHRLNCSKIKTYYAKDHARPLTSEKHTRNTYNNDNWNGNGDVEADHRDTNGSDDDLNDTDDVNSNGYKTNRRFSTIYDHHQFQYQLEQLNSNKRIRTCEYGQSKIDKNNNNSIIDDNDDGDDEGDGDDDDKNIELRTDISATGGKNVITANEPVMTMMVDDSCVANDDDDDGEHDNRKDYVDADDHEQQHDSDLDCGLNDDDDENSIKLFNGSTSLNDNYSYKSNDCYLDIISVKFAISTLKLNISSSSLSTIRACEPNEKPIKSTYNDFHEQNEENIDLKNRMPSTALTIGTTFDPQLATNSIDLSTCNMQQQQKLPLTPQTYANTNTTLTMQHANNPTNSNNGKKIKKSPVSSPTGLNNQQHKASQAKPTKTDTGNYVTATHESYHSANSSASPSSSSSSSSSNQLLSTSFKLLNTNGTSMVNGTSKDDHENIVWNGYSKKSTKLLHAFNIGQTGGVNTNNNFNVFKLPITDQTTPSLIETPSRSNGDNLNDNLAMEVT